jgi:hypothetical protein
MLEFSIKSTMHMLGSNWALQIYHSKHNEAMVRGIVGNDSRAILMDMEVEVGRQ